MTIAEAIRAGEAALTPTGVEDPRLNAELVLAEVLGRKRPELKLDPSAPVSAESETRFRELTRNRATRRPLQYVLGNQEFMGLRFEVTPAVLVPRVDTEVLVDAVLQRAELLPGEPIVADIGTGCGAIGLSLAHFLPQLRVYATDLSSAALEVARRNATHLGLTERVRFRCGDLLAPLTEWELQGQVNLVTANLPYVPRDQIDRLAPEIRDHEPRLALDGGPDGLEVVRRFLGELPEFLRADGFVALEIGYDQAEALQQILTESEWFGNVETLQDLSGKDRVVIASGRGDAQ